MKKIAILVLVLISNLVAGASYLFYQNLTINVAHASGSNSNVYVFVEETIYCGIESSLLQYESDISGEGYNVTFVNVTQSTGAESIRDTLANASNVVGCLLVGNVPTAWVDITEGEKTGYYFSTDFYFMDLDGNWSDTDGNGRFDEHTNGTGDVQPEIWCGRIKGWDTNETQMINTYFTKVHKLRTGQLMLPSPQRALVYIDDHWVTWHEEAAELWGSYYDNVTVVSDKQTTAADDYISRLGEGYESICLLSHGSPGAHRFYVPDPNNESKSIPEDKWVYVSDYIDVDPKSFLMEFYTCWSADHTFYDGTAKECLAGAWIFAPTYGMMAIGSTYAGGMLGQKDLYDPLFGEGKSIGEAFREWAVKHGENKSWGYQHWHVTLFGDPTLKRPATYIRAEDQYENLLTTGDIYLDGSLFAYTNSTVGVWSGNHTIFVNDFWKNSENRCTFDHWENNSTSPTRNITVVGNANITAYFETKYCPGDANGNGYVNGQDAVILGVAFGSKRGDSNWDSRADLNADGFVNSQDSAILGTNWGNNYN